MQDTWTVLEALQWTASYFERKECLSPRLDAELLLAEVLGTERIQLYVQYQRPLTVEERQAFRGFVGRRGKGEPVQYILGEQEFWSIPFRVQPGVLIPRADTEVLVEEALTIARELGAVDPDSELWLADIGTGSGAIAVALASELPRARVVAGDISPVALETAQANAEQAGFADRIRWVEGAGLAPLAALSERPFHVVASNPPYICESEHPGLMREVRDWEPRDALVSGSDGLNTIREIIAEAARPERLVSGGGLVLEIGSSEQAETVTGLLQAQGFISVTTRRDYAGRDRVVVGRWP